MRHILPVLSLFLCVAIVLAENNDVDVNQPSSQLTFKKASNFVHISFLEIIEISEHGTKPQGKVKHSYSNFANDKFLIKSEESEGVKFEQYEEVENITASRQNMSAYLNGPGATLDLQIITFENHTLVMDGESGDRYQIYNGTTQVVFSLNNWPFCGGLLDTCDQQGEYVDVYLNVTGKAEQVSRLNHAWGRATEGKGPKSYTVGGADVTFSGKYMTNDTWNSLPEDYPRLLTDGRIVVRLPASTTPVSYSIVVSVSGKPYTQERSAADETFTSLFFVALLAFNVFTLNYFN